MLIFRYAPYPMAPTGMQSAATVSQMTNAAPNHQQQQQNPQLTAAPTYPGYNFSSVDMSGFNGIDWASMYGMYV